MNLEQIKKKIKVEAVAPFYHNSRVVRGGEQVMIERHNFTEGVVFAVGKDGARLDRQPENLDGKMVMALLAKEKKDKELAAIEAAKKGIVADSEEEESYYEPEGESSEQEVLEASPEAQEESGADSLV